MLTYALQARANKDGTRFEMPKSYGGHVSSAGRLLRDVHARVGELLKGWDDGLEVLVYAALSYECIRP